MYGASESMDARLSRTLLVAALLAASLGASYPTPNFLIETRDPGRAAMYGQTAERLRRELAIAWVGEEMPRWADRCRITVEVGERLGAGGATTFLFDRGEVFGWRMTIQGPHERILDSVLPHEITHMVLASYFRCPLPRWADEGAATSAEHPSERMRHRKMLVEFLQEDRGIPFNNMFAMKEYPRDIMPLYAQGFSLAEYLIQTGGRRKFLTFLNDGLQNDQWAAAISRHYGHASLGMLQNSWLNWVARGFPQIDAPRALAADQQAPPRAALASQSRPRPNLIYRDGGGTQPAADFVSLSPQPASALNSPINSALMDQGSGGWRASGETPETLAPERAGVLQSAPQRAHLSHPMPPERPRQIILQWERP